MPQRGSLARGAGILLKGGFLVEDDVWAADWGQSPSAATGGTRRSYFVPSANMANLHILWRLP
jgi:hypothetical protein